MNCPALGPAERFDEWSASALGSVMSSDNTPPNATAKTLSPAAKRALKEAADRRKAQNAASSDRPTETAGPKGAEPTRYGDWERGGIAYDF